MEKTPLAATVPSLEQAQEALVQLATQDALTHLEAALRSLQGLSGSLKSADPLSMEDKRLLERSLLRFRAELRDAGVLADRGLAYCKDWAEQLQPVPAYQSNGAFANRIPERTKVSIDG